MRFLPRVTAFVAPRAISRALPLALLAALAAACARSPAPAAPVATAVRDSAVRDSAVRDSVAGDAARRDTLARGVVRDGSFWSPSLGVTKRYRVWLPPGYDASAARDVRYPVAFYLHGLYGDETNWTRQGALGATLDSLVAAGLPPMIVVTPDGDDAWYVTWNTLVDVARCRGVTRREPAEHYCVPWARYDEYVARDLVAHVDATYRTRAARASRAIAGLSMGGYGAVTLALRYPDVFAAAASHSGVLSPLLVNRAADRAAAGDTAAWAPPPAYASSPAALEARWKRLWPGVSLAFGRDTAAWWARDPARLARRARDVRTAAAAPMPALWFDAGTEDAGIIDENRAFAWELAALGIAHEWHPRPGRHDWAYWRTNAAHSLRWIGERIGR